MWNPIETAPKDKDIVVIGNNGKWWARIVWSGDYQDEWTDITSDGLCHPTHWMSLPTLPKDEE